MGSRLGRRVVHFTNLPIKLLMPSSFNNITEIAIKTIPSASKIEIKRVLESLYGFEVEKVQTLNMEGKKKKRGGILMAKPDYKKAYITLRSPLSVSPDLFPIKIIQEEKNAMNKKSKTSIVGDEDDENKKKKSHWLEKKEANQAKLGKGSLTRAPSRPRILSRRVEETTKFPWSSLRTNSRLFILDGISYGVKWNTICSCLIQEKLNEMK